MYRVTITTNVSKIVISSIPGFMVLTNTNQ